MHVAHLGRTTSAPWSARGVHQRVVVAVVRVADFRVQWSMEVSNAPQHRHIFHFNWQDDRSHGSPLLPATSWQTATSRHLEPPRNSGASRQTRRNAATLEPLEPKWLQAKTNSLHLQTQSDSLPAAGGYHPKSRKGDPSSTGPERPGGGTLLGNARCPETIGGPKPHIRKTSGPDLSMETCFVQFAVGLPFFDLKSARRLLALGLFACGPWGPADDNLGETQGRCLR